MSAKRRNVSRRITPNSPPPIPWLLTCEHAGNEIPTPYRSLFKGQKQLLNSHRGWDPGTLELGKHLQARLKSPLVVNKVSRLLIENNRSLNHPQLFSAITRELTEEVRNQLIEDYYLPHHNEVENHVLRILAKTNQVVHIGVHSFTPIMHGIERNADVGLLYDPQYLPERRFCAMWKRELGKLNSSLRIRLNYPYRGASDGLTQTLRRKYAKAGYVGIELEVNQLWAKRGGAGWRNLMHSLSQSLLALSS